MGMYTELILGCSLSEKTPRILIEALDWVINSKKKPKYENPKNYEEKIYNERFIDRTFSEKEIEEFEKKYDLCCIIYSGSYYFGCADSKPSFYKDDISKDYKLSFRSNCKNGGIIENFLEYIKPYIIQGSGPSDVYAYVQYEEDEFPTIYSLKYDKTNVLDPDIVEKFWKKNDLEWKCFDKLYKLVTPGFQVTDEMLKSRGVDPNDRHSDLAILDIIVDKICEDYKKAVNHD